MGGGVWVAVTSRDEQSLASPIIRLKYSSFILPLMCVFIYCLLCTKFSLALGSPIQIWQESRDLVVKKKYSIVEETDR